MVTQRAPRLVGEGERLHQRECLGHRGLAERRRRQRRPRAADRRPARATRGAPPRPARAPDRSRPPPRSRSRRSTVVRSSSSITLCRLKWRCAIRAGRRRATSFHRAVAVASSRARRASSPIARPSIRDSTSTLGPGCAEAIASGSAACTPACAASDASSASCSTRCFAVANGALVLDVAEREVAADRGQRIGVTVVTIDRLDEHRVPSTSVAIEGCRVAPWSGRGHQHAAPDNDRAPSTRRTRPASSRGTEFR